MSVLRFAEFLTAFAATIAAAVFYFAPQTRRKWSRTQKFLMITLVLAFATSELLLKDLTGRGYEDRVGHFLVMSFAPLYRDLFALIDLAPTWREQMPQGTKRS